MYIAGKDETRINEEITAKEVRLINVEGQQVGIVSIAEALKLSEASNLDLVEISPKANPPVCKVMDYGKFKYEISKRDKELKKKQHHVELKEIRLRPKTEENDLNTKVTNARKFLTDKNKVKITVMFRGREMAYQEFGRNLLEKVIVMVEDIAKVESEIKSEGRNMHMILTFK